MPNETKTPATLPEFASRGDIERLVDAFYERIRHDEMLGFIFDDVAHVDWSTHLPKMYAFWDAVIFARGGFAGNPLAAHLKLVPHTAMGLPQFERWIAIFTETVDRLFTGEKAGHLKRCAEDMAHVIHARINGVPDARFDPARLTPGQRARYAKYKAAPAA